MTLTARVIAAIDKYFPESDRAAVAELLSRCAGASEQGAERIHLLILRMSRREVARVRSLVKAAQRDYRDVIMWESNPTRTYIVGLLRRGPNAAPGDKTTLKLASLKRWKDAGAITIGGLFIDDSDARGIYIFTVDSVEAALALAGTDPAIQSGALMFEFHPWLTVDGLQVGVPKDFLDV
jgi:hypothetical protein